MATKIEWTQETWNPITGCTKISPGCKNCYAERMSKRLAGRFGYPKDDPFRVTFRPLKVYQPMDWKKPRTIFVCSMGDLFHKKVDIGWIRGMVEVMLAADQHIYQVLTKRPQRMKECLDWLFDGRLLPAKLPDHIWLGVTAENQKQADIRIPILLSIPAAIHGVSIEPMLGAIDLEDHLWTMEYSGVSYMGISEMIPTESNLSWIVCGAETGPGKRPMDLDWARSLRDQCQAAGVKFFFKRDSDGNRELDGRLWEEMPESAVEKSAKDVGRGKRK
jgi:protein gp37